MTRIGWADNLKFVGIALIILGHFHIPLEFQQYIYSFHVPLFFFISGFIFKSTRYGSYPKYLIKRVRSLLVPYFIFAFLAWTHWFYNKTRVDPMDYILRNYDHYFIGAIEKIIYSNELSPFNEPLWFLTCLFIVVNIYYPIGRFVKRWQAILPILVAFSILGYLYSINFERRLPWHMEVVLIGTFFYGLGNITRPLLEGLRGRLKGWKGMKAVPLLVGLLAINLIGSSLNGRVGLFSNIYGSFHYFMITALAGVLFYVLISMLIPSHKAFTFFGRNTLIIYCTHLFLIHNMILYLHDRLYPSIPYGHLPLGHGIAYTLLILLIMVPTIIIINRFLPFLVGKWYPNFDRSQL
ncbi:MAG: acyltransferase family protein [Thermoplasmata archaeon]|nr:acyltransferase family protein [Thermoplasmata archaeon]